MTTSTKTIENPIRHLSFITGTFLAILLVLGVDPTLAQHSPESFNIEHIEAREYGEFNGIEYVEHELAIEGQSVLADGSEFSYRTLALLLTLGACSDENDTKNDLNEALATAPTVEVNFSFGQKTFGDYDYEFVDATMRGTIQRDDGSTGEYAVPIKLAYPDDGGSDVGVVDFVNSATLLLSSQAAAGSPHACVRGENPLFCHEEEGDSWGRAVDAKHQHWALNLAEDYLMREGYTYMALQWSKAVVEHLGPEPPEGYTRHRLSYGTIEEPVDQFKVKQEASRWLRDPSRFEGSAAPDAEPPASDYVVGSGFSWTSRNSFQRTDFNEFEDGLFYDGFLWFVGAGCVEPDADWPYREELPCPMAFDGFLPWQTGEAKVITLFAEGDLLGFPAYMARDPREADPAFPLEALGMPEPEGDPNPNYRQWEVAGTAHLPPAYFDLTAEGTDGPLRTGFRPVARAAFHHMERWLKDDVPPPPSAHVAGDEVDEEGWPDEGLGVLVLDRDDDGNALGGIRLPHLPRELDDGRIIGAPVGTYVTHIDVLREQDPPNELAATSGTFKRFSDEELAERYPTREDYLERYKAALDAVIAEGYVLEEDRDRLLARAGEVDIPEAPEAADPPDAAEECIGHGCPEESGIDLPEGGQVRLELVHQSHWGPEVRTSAWFAGDQAPETRPFPRPPEHWHVQDGDDLCRDLRDGDFFPGGDVESRAYLDAGETVQLVADEAEITLPRVENGQDDATWQWHDILYREHVSPTGVVAGADYDVVIAGGDDFPETTFDGALHMPADFQFDFPKVNDPVVILAGRDFRFLAEDRPDPHEFDFAFIGFKDQYGPIGFCIGPSSEYITVPAEFIDQVPPGGVVQFGVLNHRVEERDGRRIDFIGVNSREARYLVDDEYLLGSSPD